METSEDDKTKVLEECPTNTNNEKPPNVSNSNLSKPDESSNNMNDLKTIDFNSADEIRQIMKAVLTEKGPRLIEDADDSIIISDNGDHHEIKSPKQSQKIQNNSDDCKNIQDIEINALRNTKPVTVRVPKKGIIGGSKKRPGRPPIAGPSKKLKKRRASSMYLGKLANVVFLKRYRSKTESSIDSLLF